MTLYEQINDSKNAISNWVDPTYKQFTWFGLILKERTFADMETVIEDYVAASNWNNVAETKRQCEFLGHDSARIDLAVKQFLTNMPMFSSYKVPKTDAVNHYFNIGYSAIHGCRWSRELNHETSKWNAQNCFDGLQAITNHESDAWYRGNPDTPNGDQYYNGRMYEKNQLACSYWDLYEAGVLDAAAAIRQMWTYMLTHWNYWGLSPSRFDYAKYTGYDGWVWDGLPEIVSSFGRYQVATRTTLPNWSYVLTDLGPRYLDSGFTSKQWVIDGGTAYKFIVHHNDATNKRLMYGETLAFIFLHQYYDYLSATQKATFQNMLKGVGHTQAWQTMISATAGMFDSGTDKFRYESGDTPTDYATAYATATLFLLGICPGTYGRLALPLRTQLLGTNYSLDPNMYQWDEDNEKIRISVFAGDLTFMYGSSNVSYTFKTDGVYHVYFNSDYTEIQKVVKISDLPGDYYLTWSKTDHPDFKRMLESKAAGSAIWRKLILTYRDGVTGWYKPKYVEYPITVVAGASGVASQSLGPGTFQAQTLMLMTSYPVQPQDQLVYKQRYYEVEDVEEFYYTEGSQDLFCYRFRAVQLPLHEEA